MHAVTRNSTQRARTETSRIVCAAARAFAYGTLVVLFSSGCHALDPGHTLADAAAAGDTAVVLRLLNAGISPNTRWGEYGTPVLIFAIDGDHVRTVDALLAHGAVVDERVSDGADTPLIQASAHGCGDIVDVLIKHGAAMDAHSTIGMTPLMAACWQGQEGVVRKLLECGANRTLRDNKGATAMTYAIRYLKYVKALELAKATARLRGTAQDAERVSSARRIVTLLNALHLPPRSGGN